jgi:hypothetical protein
MPLGHHLICMHLPMKCKATIRSPYQGGRPLLRQRSYPREHTSSFVWPSCFPREVIDPPARIRSIASNHDRRPIGSTRNSPYYVNCFSLPISLQHQNTWSFSIVGIFLYQLSRPNFLNYVAHLISSSASSPYPCSETLISPRATRSRIRFRSWLTRRTLHQNFTSGNVTALPDQF